jgi:maltose alpha-D-glucosyltransferase/alpha-amylase
MVPVELFGRTEFPPVGDGPYPMTLGPHSFFWFSLELARIESIDVEVPQPRLSLDDRQLERALPLYLVGQRWFRGKTRVVKEVEVVDTIPMAHARLKLVELRYREGDPDTYALPLAPDGEGGVVDALTEPGFNALLLEAIAQRRRFRGRRGDLLALPTQHLARLRSSDHRLDPRLSSAEQSNNSVVFGERLILKLFRRLESGVNPDLEVSRFLTERRFPNVAPVAGALLYRWGRDQAATLAMLQAYVPNQGDAWSHALDELASEDVGAIERYVPFAELLGKRTAEMHVALASAPKDPAFAPEATTMLDARSAYQSIRSLAVQVFQTLRRQLPGMAGEDRADAEDVMAVEEHLHRRLRALLETPISARRIRCHGDYHLGQLLFTGGDFVIVDFEGEPARPLAERRLKRWAMRDLAGMLRSFDYAAEAAGVGFAREWARRTSLAFTDAYWEAAGDAVFVPTTSEERDLLMDVLQIEKALYELRYELDNRPAWVRIPLRGLLSLVGER